MVTIVRKRRRVRNPALLRSIGFEFTNDPVTPACELARTAVLDPIAKALGVESDQPQKVAQVVLMRWRNRLVELRDLGWKPLQETTNWLAALNCSPATVQCSVASSIQCQYTICPLCHTRRIVRLLDRIGYGDRENFFKSMEGLSPMRFWRPTVGEVKEEQMGRTPDAVVPTEPDTVRRAVQILAGDCLQLATAYRRLATGVAWWLPAWSAPLEPEDQAVLFTSPQLLTLIPRDATVLVAQNWKCKTYKYENAIGLDQAVQQAFQDTFAYPVPWLTAPVREVNTVLEGRSELRLAGYSGRFRAPPATSLRQKGNPQAKTAVVSC